MPPFYSFEQEPDPSSVTSHRRKLILAILSQISIFMGLAVSLLLWGLAAIYNHDWGKVKLALPIDTHCFVSEENRILAGELERFWSFRRLPLRLFISCLRRQSRALERILSVVPCKAVRAG